VSLAEQLGRTVFLLAQGTYKAREFRPATYLVAVEVGMALKGNLRDFSVTQLLNLINLARKTGTLAIDTRETQARLCFKEGKLIYAMTDGQDDHLAAMLQRAGKITEEQAHAIQTRADVKSDKELGLLLMNAGYVSKDDIVKSVRIHILNNVYSLFTWSEGTFRFESNVLPFEDRITIPIGLESVIMEGSRRLKEWERLQEELPDLNHALRFAERPEARLRDISLSVEEWRVVSFINPRNTIRQIAQYNNMSDFQIRKIVYGLLQAGLVALVWPEGTAVPVPSATPGQTPVAMHRPAVKRGVVERLIAFFQRS
jgi:predicted DNA-binding transcriptional regulator